MYPLVVQGRRSCTSWFLNAMIPVNFYPLKMFSLLNSSLIFPLFAKISLGASLIAALQLSSLYTANKSCE